MSLGKRRMPFDGHFIEIHNHNLIRRGRYTNAAEKVSLPHPEEHVSWSNARPRAHWVRGADQLHAEYTTSVA
jgi:hypothetical protein